ncbi:MAG: hypothetical protein Q4B23_02125 [Helcococcus sp.]|nr:hypothetical protein [Helcococcus sp.]
MEYFEFLNLDIRECKNDINKMLKAINYIIKNQKKDYFDDVEVTYSLNFDKLELNYENLIFLEPLIELVPTIAEAILNTNKRSFNLAELVTLLKYQKKKEKLNYKWRFAIETILYDREFIEKIKNTDISDKDAMLKIIEDSNYFKTLLIDDNVENYIPNQQLIQKKNINLIIDDDDFFYKTYPYVHYYALDDPRSYYLELLIRGDKKRKDIIPDYWKRDSTLYNLVMNRKPEMKDWFVEVDIRFIDIINPI